MYKGGHKRPQIIFRHRATPEYMQSIKSTLQGEMEREVLKQEGQIESIDETYSPFIMQGNSEKNLSSKEEKISANNMRNLSTSNTISETELKEYV